MCKRIFFDANIIVDIFDTTRENHIDSLKVYAWAIENNCELFTSCDIVTTIYYIVSKKGKQEAREKIRQINKIIQIIEFSNAEVEQTCALMSEDSCFNDLEDTVQYVLAQAKKCDVIITNDQQFHSPDIALHTSKSFLELL
ncbi:type II toxin-antitoxin system VapC family toxin [Sulfuricurvum sp.]|uniref:type II toxin-antitoxin system VapC family toxin n=1 Tax=Sulfuricurvum sp. TaxID=2025608 RepID=UPI003BB513AD